MACNGKEVLVGSGKRADWLISPLDTHTHSGKTDRAMLSAGSLHEQLCGGVTQTVFVLCPEDGSSKIEMTSPTKYSLGNRRGKDRKPLEATRYPSSADANANPDAAVVLGRSFSNHLSYLHYRASQHGHSS